MSTQKTANGYEGEITLEKKDGQMYVMEIDMIPRTAEDEQKMMELSSGEYHQRGFAMFGKYDQKKRVMSVDVAFRPKHHG